MKKIFSYSLFSILLFATSCEKGFDDLNKNKVSPTSLDATLLLNNAIRNISYGQGTFVFDMGIVQQYVTPFSGVLSGANFNIENRDQGNSWAQIYQGVVKYTHDAIVKTKADASRSNLYNMARIYQAYAFMILTDTYGDIPYSEGGAGFPDLVFYPKYDAQQSIYTGIISELTQAATALNAAGTIEKADILYSGDVAKWKKFAYSLLLRAGMRLSKVDVAKAQATVQAAFAGGVITSNADNAMIRHTSEYQSGVGGTANGQESGNFYLAKPFVDQLKNTNDPRLAAIAVRYPTALSATDQTAANGNINPANQIGMQIGKDQGQTTAAAIADGLTSFYQYSQGDRRRILKVTAPAFLVTASQTALLLAEARFKGWITTGTAAQYFSDGIAAHMDQMTIFDVTCAVSNGARDTYVAANPLGAGTELQQINTQYWISSFLNGPEAWANFRRSGFPALAPNPYPSTFVAPGGFIRRLNYPNSEFSVNKANLDAAIARQGPDALSTRVWWDKP